MAVAHLALPGQLALYPAPDGVWYLRGEEGRARVGRATIAGSTLEAPAGPLPVAIVATGDAVIVLEGVPTLEPHQPRVDVIERLDPATLNVVASLPVPGLPTDFAIADGTLWVATTNGGLHAYDAATLAPSADLRLNGGGLSQIVARNGLVWVLNGRVDEDGTEHLFLHRIDPNLPAAATTATISGLGSSGVLAIGSRVWVGTLDPNVRGGQGRLLSFTLDGVAGEALTIPAPSGLTEANGWLWWASADGRLGAVDVNTFEARTPLRVGTGATDVAVSGDLVWVAAGDLVVVRPE